MDRPDLLERVRAVDEELVDTQGAAVEDGRTIDELLAALAGPDAAGRCAAAAALATAAPAAASRLGDVVRALRAAAADPVPAVRAVAVAALVCLSPDKLLPEVVKSLRSEDPRVVAGAAVVLGHAFALGATGAGGGPAGARVRAAVPNLVEAFHTDDAQVGRAVAWALGRIGDRAVVPWLVAALEQGFAAPHAALALGRIGDPRAAAALRAALDDDDDELRAAAARALGRVRGADDGPRLELLLADRAPRVRLCAALALYERGEDAPLAAALADHER